MKLRGLRLPAVLVLLLLVLVVTSAEPCADQDVCGPCTEIEYTETDKSVLSCTQCSGLYKTDKAKTMPTRLVSSSSKIGDELCSKNLIYGLAALGGIVLLVTCIAIACWWNGKDLRNKVMVFRQRRYVMRTENDIKPIQDESMAANGLQTGAMRVIRGYVVNPDASQLESQRTPQINEEPQEPMSSRPQADEQIRTSTPMQVKRPTLTLNLPRLKTDPGDRLPSLVKPKPLVKLPDTQVELEARKKIDSVRIEAGPPKEEGSIEPSTEGGTEISRPGLEDLRSLRKSS